MGQIIGVISSIAVAGASYLESRDKAHVTTERTAAEASAKSDHNYEVLVEAVKSLATRDERQQETIGEMRENIGELKGRLRGISGRPSGGRWPRDDIGGSSGGDHSEHEHGESKSVHHAIHQLPDAAPTAHPDRVQQYMKQESPKE